MPAHFFDLDGTLLQYHSEKTRWTPGAKEYLQYLEERGDFIMFVTMRGTQDADKPWSVEATEAFMKEEGMDHIPIVYGVPAGRTLYDDVRPSAVWMHPRDKGFKDYLK